ncbi:MAG: FUSC family protein [Dermatophilaceae bacterium]|nr:FUSC family protein [Dermatophilaceae bacterium]
MSPETGSPESPWRPLADWAWPGHPATWREVPRRLRPTLGTVLRLTAAAVAAYVLSQVITPGTPDLTGPLTALLVVQASAFSTIKMSAVRVGAVLSGILVATLLSTWIGLTWWSLGAAIAASLLLAKVLRLGEQALETPISAMLILGVSNHDIASETRILNTLIGAAVGVAFNVVYPPAMPIGPARQALLRVVEAAASALDQAAEALERGPVARPQVAAWIDRVRSANREVARATETISHLKESRRFNPRALGTVDVEPVLASALDTFEQCLLAIRALFTLVLAELPPEDAPEDTYGDELRSAFAVVLHDSADCLRAFGGFVIAESEGREKDTEKALAQSLDILRETQAILTELILVRAREDTSWLLRGSVLAAVEQVLARLDLEDRARVHQQWKEAQQRRPLAQLPRIVHDALPHPDRPYPRGLQRGRGRRRDRHETP